MRSVSRCVHSSKAATLRLRNSYKTSWTPSWFGGASSGLCCCFGVVSEYGPKQFRAFALSQCSASVSHMETTWHNTPHFYWNFGISHPSSFQMISNNMPFPSPRANLWHSLNLCSMRSVFPFYSPNFSLVLTLW